MINSGSCGDNVYYTGNSHDSGTALIKKLFCVEYGECEALGEHGIGKGGGGQFGSCEIYRLRWPYGPIMRSGLIFNKITNVFSIDALFIQ